MSAFMCSRCAAPLPADAAEGKAPCPYCGALNAPKIVTASSADLESLSAIGTPKAGSKKASSKSALRIVLVMLLLGITIPAALIILAGTHHLQLRTVPSDLKKLPSSTWRPLDVVPPSGGYAAFDPAANVLWATAIARQWAADASLEFIEVSRLRPEGTVNTQDDTKSEIQYRYISHALMTEYERQAEFGKTQQITELFIRVGKGGSSALTTSAAPSHDDSPTSYDPKALPFPKIMETLYAKGKLRKRPYYVGQMYFGRDGKWWWDLKTLSGDESLAHVNAETGISTH
jgi:hypothetical protein